MENKFTQGYENLTDNTTLNERLAQRLEKDSKEIKDRFLKQSKEDIYNQCFRIVIYELFEEYINWASEKLEEEELQKNRYFEKLIEQDKNILELLFDYYNNLRHPEYYNIYYFYDDVATIIENCVKEL